MRKPFTWNEFCFILSRSRGWAWQGGTGCRNQAIGHVELLDDDENDST
jgi:hypothetical protein